MSHQDAGGPALPPVSFADLPVHPSLLRQLQARSYTQATPVQAAVLEAGLAELDLLVSSRTGSGKTVAFGLALASSLLGDSTKVAPAKQPSVLVVAPTRELAQQVARELDWLFATTGVRIVSCVGGMDFRRQQQGLRQGAHIVVGTPGRICDHLERKNLVLAALQAVVLDEADEMLDMGFRDELERILEASPKERRTLLFSATLPRGIETLARRYTREAKRVVASALATPHADISYLAHLVVSREREHAVVNVLRYHDAPSALVFCARREGVAHLQAALVERGFSAEALSGELSQPERNRALLAMRESRSRVLVATDVAARGLDLPAVGLVIHADLPQNPATLQHRSGRTGRAGRKGTAVILVPMGQRQQAERMARAAGIAMRFSAVPSAEEVRHLDRQRLVDDLGARIAQVEPDDVETGRSLLEKFSAEAIAGAFARTLRRSFPAAEELPLTTAARERKVSGAPLGNQQARQRQRREPPSQRHRDRAPRQESGVWFRVNIGRDNNADPRWLLPMLCRRGKVTKRDIGHIDIRRHETRFELNPKAAARFEQAARRPDAREPQIRIERAP